MSRRVVIVIICILIGAPSQTKLGQAAEDASALKRPNFVIILTDDQGYGDIAAHGNPVVKTPNLDRLSKQSVRFDDFHAAPMCTPTRGQLMTGRDALDNGAIMVCMGRSLMREGLLTMPQVFSEAGYGTGIFGKWHLGDSYPHRPMDRGFTYQVRHRGFGITSVNDSWNNDYFDPTLVINGDAKTEASKQFKGFCTDVFFDEALKWMKTNADQSKPFFTYLSLNAPHWPFWSPEKYRKLYPGRGKERVDSFLGMITNIDDNIAKLDAFLKQEKLYDNTILIFMTDNGTVRGDKICNSGMRGKKRSLYEGGHRVPFYMRWPAGNLRSRSVRTPVQVQDIFPTLVDLCGLSTDLAAAELDGVSLAELIRTGKEIAPRKMVIQYGIDEPGVAKTRRFKKGEAAVIWNQWRLVNHAELYDINRDPGQKMNVAAKRPAVVKELQAHYDRWWKEIDPESKGFVPVVIDPKHQNPAVLASSDWNNVYADTAGTLRLAAARLKRGDDMAGQWTLDIRQAGEYRITMRRWPADSGLAIGADAPVPVMKLGDPAEIRSKLPFGKALPITGARVSSKTMDFSFSRPVDPTAKEITFKVQLKSGLHTLKTEFLDKKNKPLCGSFVTDVLYLDE